MAQGYLMPPHATSGWRKFADLLTNQTTTTAGTWVELEGFTPALVTIGGTFNATTQIQIQVCNESTKPADSDVTKAPYGDLVTDGTGPQSIIINEPVRYIKVRVIAIGNNSSVSAGVMAGRMV